MKKILTILILLSIMACDEQKSSQGEAFTSSVDKNAATISDDSDKLAFFDNPINPIEPKFEMLPTGSSKPKGWLLNLMKEDLEKGMVGHLDDLVPYIMEDDLYADARRGGMEDVPLVGDQVLTGEPWEISMLWWNGETIGNWWDGFVRHAFLTDNEEAIKKSHEIVDNLLASQDKDGYIGIYKENMRYQHEGSNGELWTKTTAMRMLLGYYELTGKEEVLKALEAAMDNLITNYGEGGTSPFDLKNAYGGVTHGLMMTDVCEGLYRITGKDKYRDYAVYLYKEFSRYGINRSFNDMRFPYLIEKDSLYEGHAAHTYEHLRSVLFAYYATGYPELKQAFQNSMTKLDPCILPSGSGHGNEWIAKQRAHPDHTAAEFCSILHLRNSYSSAAQKTGDISYADQAEKITFNSILGARNENGTAITYGKPDNCYLLDGKIAGEDGSEAEPRLKYSPTHSDPAVCCVPNYTRNLSYYIDQMWMKAKDGLVAVLYGPVRLKTQVNGITVQIDATTNYPFSDQIDYQLSNSTKGTYAIYFRKPAWVKSMDIEADGATIELEEGYYKVSKEWGTSESITLRFDYEIEAKPFYEEVYFQRGPLVYAYAIPHEEKTVKTYALERFRDYHCFPTDSQFENLSWQKDFKGTDFEFIQENPDADGNPWYASNTYLKGKLYDTDLKETKIVRLHPFGGTILRRVTFPVM